MYPEDTVRDGADIVAVLSLVTGPSQSKPHCSIPKISAPKRLIMLRSSNRREGLRDYAAKRAVISDGTFLALFPYKGSHVMLVITPIQKPDGKFR